MWGMVQEEYQWAVGGGQWAEKDWSYCPLPTVHCPLPLPTCLSPPFTEEPSLLGAVGVFEAELFHADVGDGFDGFLRVVGER